jgi:hypothetical protein
MSQDTLLLENVLNPMFAVVLEQDLLGVDKGSLLGVELGCTLELGVVEGSLFGKELWAEEGAGLAAHLVAC